MRGKPGSAVVYSLLLLALLAPHARADSYFTTQGAAAEAAAAAASKADDTWTSPHCPRPAVFQHPWVKQNVALAYAHGLKDGLGGQTLRLMATYATAKALGIGFLFTPLGCVGHIGAAVHYRKKGCTNLKPSDMQQLQRVHDIIHLPTTAPPNASSWTTTTIVKATFAKLEEAAATALRLQRPTLLKIEWVMQLIQGCPDLFNHEQKWRAKAAGVSRQAGGVQGPTASESWLLDAGRSFRIAVHMRRGDVKSRELASYFVNVVQSFIRELESRQRDYTVEWYSEHSTTPEEHEDIHDIRRAIPNLTLLLDSDNAWNWQQMATADVFVMSASQYSYVPGVLNTQGLVLAPLNCRIWLPHWVRPGDALGRLTDAVRAELDKRLGQGSSSSSSSITSSNQQ